MMLRERLQRGMLLVLIAALVFGWRAAGAAPESKTPSSAAAPVEGYAEPGTCATCHQEEAAALQATAHGKTGATTWDGIAGCESCHGPGAAHVEAGGDKTKIRNPGHLAAAELNAVCMTCHERGDRSHWTGSPHEGRGLTCTTCHSIHHAASPTTKLLTKKTEFETCTTCH